MYFELIDSNTVQYGVPSDGKRGQNNDATKGSYIVVLLKCLHIGTYLVTRYSV